MADGSDPDGRDTFARLAQKLRDWDLLAQSLSGRGTPLDPDAAALRAQAIDIIDRSAPLLSRLARPEA